jgi:hypothetical protein
MVPKADLAPTPSDDSRIDRVRYQFLRIIKAMPPEPEPASNPNISYNQETLETAETQRILAVTDEVLYTIRQSGTVDSDGQTTMPFEEICADIIKRHGISRTDIIIGIFEAAAKKQFTMSGDGLNIVITPEVTTT